MSATPALTALLSVAFFKDPLDWKKILAIGLAVGGVLVLQLGGPHKNQHQSVWGILLVIAAIFCEATYTLLGKALTKDYPPEDIATFSAVIAFIGFVPITVWQYHSGIFEQTDLNDWLALIAYGAVTMGLGSVLWYMGIKQVQGSTAAAFMGVMPVSALVLSYVLLGESFRWLHLVGFALVFSGVLLIISVHRKMMAKS